jgi:hypothetical protein
MKQEEYAGKPIRTLGEVILLLQAQPEDNIVRLDFTSGGPWRLHSYRGYYEDLSLDYRANAEPLTVKQLLALFEKADGQTFSGYKGGDFKMHRKTLVWVAPYGSTGRMLVDIKNTGTVTTVCTEEEGSE